MVSQSDSRVQTGQCINIKEGVIHGTAKGEEVRAKVKDVLGTSLLVELPDYGSVVHGISVEDVV